MVTFKEHSISELCSFKYGEQSISYKLFYVHRTTMEIAVLPDCSVVVKAPLSSDMSVVESAMKKRSRWILKQLRYFEQFNPRQPPRQYIKGETHLYLGRRYRLKISAGESDSVKLMHGYFVVTCRNHDTSPEKVKTLLDKWYRDKAGNIFRESLEAGWKMFNDEEYQKPVMAIRDMKMRWGSLSPKGTMTLNIALIRAPRECIDYVILHELCHLKFRNHNKDFYKQLTKFMPDWEKTKHRLETVGT